MIPNEQQIEQQFIEKLQELSYTYRDDIHDLASLERNFRQKFEKLNMVTLSNDEFEKLKLQIITADVFKASKCLRNKQTFTRDDGTPLIFSLVNLNDWCKNDFEVVNQLNINTANSHHRYDVIILINGLPLVQIELKSHSVSPTKAIEQIVRYKQDYGNGYTNTLMCFMQLFMVSNGSTKTMYFANNNDEHFHFDTNNSYLPVYEAAVIDPETEHYRKIERLDAFANLMLNKFSLGNLISQYMVLVETEQKILVMRPYQIYAVESIVNSVKQNAGNGFIWHTTGSGKTLTSFKASTILKNDPDIEKCVFVVDRKDLDKQTRDEFNKFQEGCVEQNINTEALVCRLESDDYADKVIVTTIQKLGVALDTSPGNRFYKRLLKLADKRIVFIFDECHRSQFGDNHKAIKSFFRKAQLFGFTGTPIFEENSTYVQVNGQQAEYVTTLDVFQKCLNKYTIIDAISDNNVLRFNVDYFRNEDKQKGDVVAERPSKTQIANHILDNHDALTGQRRFNALLAVASIPDAIEYYNLFAQIQKKRGEDNPDFVPLNIGAVFTPPTVKFDAEDLPDEERDNAEDPEGSSSGLSAIIKDYNEKFGTNFSIALFDEYYKDIQKRIKNQKYPNAQLPHDGNKLDIVIVVNMLLTGFDSKFLNTIYVDKDLRHHNLVQAFSRTNRILDGTKPYGNVVCYRYLENNVNDAMLLFSGYKDDLDKANQAKEYWLVEPAPVVIGRYHQAVDELRTVMNAIGVDCVPEEVANIPDGENTNAFVEAFKEVQRLALKLDQYTSLTDEEKAEIQEVMPDDTLRSFRTAYLDIVKRSRTNDPGGSAGNDDATAYDFELVLFSSAIIDYDYFMQLLAKYTGGKPSKVKVTKEQLIGILMGSANLLDEREYLEAFIEEEIEAGSGHTEEEIRLMYELFKKNRIKDDIFNISSHHGISPDALEDFINETVRLQRLDEEALRPLLSNAGNWKERKRAKEALIREMAPILKRLALGRTIDGLNAYVND